jgi:hypothetical protein
MPKRASNIPLRCSAAPRQPKQATKATPYHQSPRWRRLASHARTLWPICCDPYNRHTGVTVATQSIHHITPIQADPSRAYDIRNLVGLCNKCHAHVDALYKRGVDTISAISKAKTLLYSDTIVVAHELQGGCIKSLKREPASTVKVVTKSASGVRGGTPCEQVKPNVIFCSRMGLQRRTKCAGCMYL